MPGALSSGSSSLGPAALLHAACRHPGTHDAGLAAGLTVQPPHPTPGPKRLYSPCGTGTTACGAGGSRPAAPASAVLVNGLLCCIASVTRPGWWLALQSWVELWTWSPLLWPQASGLPWSPGWLLNPRPFCISVLHTGVAGAGPPPFSQRPAEAAPPLHTHKLRGSAGLLHSRPAFCCGACLADGDRAQVQMKQWLVGGPRMGEASSCHWKLRSAGPPDPRVFSPTERGEAAGEPVHLCTDAAPGGDDPQLQVGPGRRGSPPSHSTP